MTETKCGFCNGKEFEAIPVMNVKFAQIFQCATCGHPVGLLYDSELVQKQLRAIAKDVHSLKG